MKQLLKIAFFTTVSLCIFLTTNAQSPQQVFNKANSLYQNHSYDSAANLYKSLIDHGYKNTSLYYNAGNANYKAGHWGYAVYYFEKALQQSPGNEAIENNLQLARVKATDKIDQIPTLFFINWWHYFLNMHKPNGWIIGSIVFLWILVFILGWKILKPPLPKPMKWAAIVATVLFCIYLAGAAGSWYQTTNHSYAIIVEGTESIRSAPDTNSGIILEAHEGLKVKLLDSLEGWKKIRLTNGTEGWIRSDNILTL